MKTHQHNAGCGELFCFHGAFTSKAEAVKKEKATPGAFVKGIHYGVGDYRHAVLTRRNPNPGVPGHLRLDRHGLKRFNQAREWMQENKSEYTSAQTLAQAAASKYDVPVKDLLPSAQKVFAKDRSAEANPASFQSVSGILQRAGLKPESSRYHRRGFAVRKLRGSTGVLFDYDGGDRDSLIAQAALKAAGFKVELREDGQTIVVRKNPLLRPAEKRLLRMKAKRGIRTLLGFGERKKKSKSKARGIVTPIRSARSSTLRDEVIEGLVSQGFARKKAVQMVPATQGGDTFDTLFKRALKKNPGLSAEQKAIQLYKDFHGSDPKKVIRMENTIVESGEYFMLGKLYGFDMSALRIQKFSDVRPNVQVKDDAGIMLCGANIEEDEDGKLAAHQLLVLGGNQNLEPKLESVFGVTSQAQLLDLGEITNIWYVAKKKQTNYQLTHWHHTFGEEEENPSKKREARPFLMYDRKHKKLFIVGGEYSIPLEGIRN